MALSREQYDNIMLEYSRIRDEHRHELTRRRNLVYARIPEFRELESAVPSRAAQSLQELLGEESDAVNVRSKLQEDLEQLRLRREALLTGHGFPADYLEMTYACPHCHDTGYIDGQKCQCLRAREVRLLYDQSHLRELTAANNFSVLSTEFYQGEDLDRFRRAWQATWNFVNNFDSDYENLYFYGTVGTGKSFLSICAAKELIQSGHSVLYFSAAALFEKLSALAFNYQNKEEYRTFAEDLADVQLLIIDDLGTELASSFVSGQLFSIINERHLRRRSTIISTNLSLEDLRNRYSDRVCSRIISGYTACKLTGPDIRIIKKVRNNGANNKTK
ncbi:MAG: ATP-binding protein [Lachnospiraceae bacterium]|nr:ATP-binding protein [Lachnospiraceae bacterium]